MNDLLELMIDQGASDLHIEVNQPPTLRISGSMVPVEGPKLDPQGAEALMKSITSETNQEQVKAPAGPTSALLTKARLVFVSAYSVPKDTTVSYFARSQMIFSPLAILACPIQS